MLELGSYTVAGIRSTKFAIPQHLLDAPDWFLYFSRDKLPNESDAIDAQMMELTLSTIENQVWSKLLKESVNNLFSGAVPHVYVICRMSPGSQQLESFKKATVSFIGDCAKFAAQQLEWLRLAKEQTAEEQAICNILIQMPASVE